MKLRKILFSSVLAMSLTVPLTALAQQSNLVPIISYDQEHPLVNLANILPMVQVFSSGEVVVFRAPGMKNPGRYEVQLSADDLNELTSLAETAGVPQLAASELVEVIAEVNSLTVATDPTTSTFEFNRVSGQNVLSAGDGTTSDVTQTVVMQDVVLTADTLADSASANALKELHIRLIQLFSQAGQ